MLDVRVSEDTDPEALVAFVERLAGSGRSGPGTAAARSRLLADVRDGRSPAGLRKLVAALRDGSADGGGDRDRPGTLGAAVAEDPLVVLSETGPEELARALGALTGFGTRILLTGAHAERLAAVRDALPASAASRVVDHLPALQATDLQRLRRLLATTGADPDRRTGQQVPGADVLPTVEDVEGCCVRARREVDGTGSGPAGEARVVPVLLRDLEADRRAAVTQVARCALGKLTDIGRAPDAGRLREIAGRLVHSGLRTEFESLQNLAARQRDDRAQYAYGPPVEQSEALPEGGETAIRRYLGFLEEGGRVRSYFKSTEQKDAEPLLRLFRTAGEVPSSYDEVAAVVQHLHLSHRDEEIARLCSALGLPVPRATEDLPGLTAALDRIAAAARSVGALRHDVLFLQQDSPVSVPDLGAAERVARAIVDYDEHGDPAEAGDELERLAQACGSAVPAEAATPEQVALVEALRAHDPEAYAAALEELGRARRELADAEELDRLLGELGAGHPDLAAAWAADAAAGVPGFGLVQVVETPALLAALPDADSADLVVVLGAAALQADGLLLTAAAPRLLAVVGDEPFAEASGTTMLEMLDQASARFLRGTGEDTATGETGEQAAATEPAPPALPVALQVPAQAGPAGPEHVSQQPVPAPVAEQAPGPDGTGIPEPGSVTGAGAAVPAPRTAPVTTEDQRPSAPAAMAPARRGASGD